MSSPFVAEIRMFGGSFAPVGWATCDGQQMPISQNTALFSLLGTAYGGDGKTSFWLPNLQGSAAMGQGSGNNLSPRFIGESVGEVSVTLLATEMPAHNHAINCYIDDPAADQTPSQNDLLGYAQGLTPYSSDISVSPTTLNAGALSMYGGSGPHNNMQPYLCVTFIIALQGVFPPRS
ncbi:MAG TPA: tail fiber protein [Rudaea sp.]|jgi:microcystin-dependent protein|nr:tail fiber protein [Rudaea sp.]HSC12963.1 tail fiber protein [Rhodanobacteraceae bacterium]